jgi:hypothetical protein
MEISKVEIFKDGELVATCSRNVKIIPFIVIPGFHLFPKISAFSLPEVELNRRKIFEVLNGKPLGALFNESGIRMFFADAEPEPRDIEPVFFVHGRCETMRGNTTISAVILLQFHCEREKLPTKSDILLHTPKLYQEISKLL